MVQLKSEIGSVHLSTTNTAIIFARESERQPRRSSNNLVFVTSFIFWGRAKDPSCRRN